MTNIKTYYKEIDKLIYFNILMTILLFSPLISFFNVDYVVKFGGMMINCFIPLSLKDIFSSDFKEKILFPEHWKHPYPGSRIFSEITENLKDERINVNKLIERYGKFPIKPEEQNQLWYKIYLQYQKENQIFYAQKEYLHYRDATAVTLIILVTFISINIILQFCYNIHIDFYELYCIYLIIQLIIFKFSAKNKSKRFAYNVLAIASQTDDLNK